MREQLGETGAAGVRGPIALGGYPAKQCPRRVHNRFAPGDLEPDPPAPHLQTLWEDGRRFEADIVAEIVRHYAGSPELLVLDDAEGWQVNQERTVDAIRRNVPVVVGGRLPDVNGRTGAPDVLIGDNGGYLPVDIKNHSTVKRSTATGARVRHVEVSTVADPARRRIRAGYSSATHRWRDDAMQLAHYSQMLLDLGWHAAGKSLGGILGTSDCSLLCGEARGIIWHDLEAPTINTAAPGRAGRRVKISVLEHYRREFAMRLDVAHRAASGGEVVRPYRTAECRTCEWFSVCAQAVGPDDASFAVETGHLTRTEWQHLYDSGGSGRLTVAQLAKIDPGAHAERFAQQGGASASRRLEDVIRRDRMLHQGIAVEPRTPGTVPQIPTADIVVDFDIEWDKSGRIYQWGLRVRDGQNDDSARYNAIASFGELDDRAEEGLATRFAEQMRALRSRAARNGRSLQVYHWSHPEATRIRKFPAVEQALDGLLVDLMAWFNIEFFTPVASSIKTVAALFGHRWPVEDPGGLASLTKIDLARAGGTEGREAQQWCLAYNEADVAAQAAIRDGLRRLMSEIGTRR